MRFITLRDGDTAFLYRVAGVCVADGRVLLQREVSEPTWVLPGGRVMVGETAAEALVREMREEIDVEVVPGGLLWVVENFFHHRPLDGPPTGVEVPDIAHHELGLYLQMTVPPPLAAADRFSGSDVAGDGSAVSLEFAWHDVASLDGIDLRPAVLRHLLAEPLPAARRTIVAGR